MDLVEVQKRKEEILVRHPWEDARIEVVKSLLGKIFESSATKNVLDIGCGDIYVISQLSKAYPHIHFYAIDIAFTPEIMEQLKKRANDKIHMFRSLDEARPHINGTADLVLLLDVIEHIEDDKGFLQSLHANPMIDAETNIMITVPAYQSLFCSHDHFLGHYRRYTNKTLEQTINETGFKKVALGYFFSSLVPPRIMQVLKEKMAKPAEKDATTGLVEWKKGKFLTSVFKNILLADFKITNAIKKVTGLSLFGLSNYVLCKKRA